jgi:hypothetical protein
MLTNKQGNKQKIQSEKHTNFLEGCLAKYVKFIKDVYNFYPGYLFLEISLRGVYKYLVSRLFILTLFVMTEILESV